MEKIENVYISPLSIMIYKFINEVTIVNSSSIHCNPKHDP